MIYVGFPVTSTPKYFKIIAKRAKLLTSNGMVVILASELRDIRIGPCSLS